jgi:hypothetical protein
MLVRRLTLLLLTVAAAALLTGCVQMHSATTIEKDGSGTATMVMSMSEAVSEAIKEMAELDPEGSQGADMPAFDDIDRATLEKRVKDYGVKITKFEKGVKDGRETVEIAYEFKDMKGMSAAMGAMMSGGEDEENGLGIFDAGDGNLVLRPATYDFPDWDAEDEDAATDEESSDAMDPELAGKQMQIMGTLMGAISELDIEMRITVPGDIVSTNAPQQEGRTSIWAINSQNMMSMESDMAPEIVFSGSGLKITPQGD